MPYVHWLAKPTPPTNSPFSIRGYGIEERMPTRLCHRPSGTDDYLFMQFHSPVRIEVAGELRDFPAHSLMIWLPGEVHRYGSETQEWNHSWLHGDGPFVRKLLRQLSLNGNTGPLAVPPHFFQRFLSGIDTELSDHLEPDPIILQNLLENWLRRVARHLEQEPRRQRATAKMLQVKLCLDRHYAHPWTLEELAKKHGLSVPHLGSEFKRSFGRAPLTYLIGQRLQHAKDLLGRSDLQIAEISQQVGYENPFYFSRLFHKHTGQSPLAYRKMILSQA